MPFSLFDAPYPERSATSAFSGNLLNRFSERRTAHCIEDALSDPNARLIVISDGKLVRRDIECESSAIFTAQYLPELNAHHSTIVLLGWDAEKRPWLAAHSTYNEDELPTGFIIVDFRQAYIQGLLPPHELGMLAQGGALLAWHLSHRFCSRCGTESHIKDGGYKRVCPNCNMEHFPRTDPVVIMLTITPDNKKCLLGRSAHFPDGMYSCLAGFVEPGETLEAAMRRETMEETSISVERVQYHSSQPWPFPHTIMIGCYGVACSKKIFVDDEIEDARWFTRQDVQQMVDGIHPEGFVMPPKGAIASNLVLDWLYEV